MTNTGLAGAGLCRQGLTSADQGQLRPTRADRGDGGHPRLTVADQDQRGLTVTELVSRQVNL